MRVPDCLDKLSKKEAKRLLRKLLKKQGWAPRVMLTDKLKICPAAKRETTPGVEQRQQNGLNKMKLFRSARQVQRFLSIRDPIANVLHLRRDHHPVAGDLGPGIATWAEVAGAPRAA